MWVCRYGNWKLRELSSEGFGFYHDLGGEVP